MSDAVWSVRQHPDVVHGPSLLRRHSSNDRWRRSIPRRTGPLLKLRHCRSRAHRGTTYIQLEIRPKADVVVEHQMICHGLAEAGAGARLPPGPRRRPWIWCLRSSEPAGTGVPRLPSSTARRCLEVRHHRPTQQRRPVPCLCRLTLSTGASHDRMRTEETARCCRKTRTGQLLRHDYCRHDSPRLRRFSR